MPIQACGRIPTSLLWSCPTLDQLCQVSRQSCPLKKAVEHTMCHIILVFTIIHFGSTESYETLSLRHNLNCFTSDLGQHLSLVQTMSFFFSFKQAVCKVNIAISLAELLWSDRGDNCLIRSRSAVGFPSCSSDRTRGLPTFSPCCMRL